MIIDAHVYCFPPLDSLAGHRSVAEHLKVAQWGHARHHQPTIRLRDRAVGPWSAALLNPAGEPPWCLSDVNFRVDHAHHRVVWTVDGEDYTKHYLPPNLHDTAFDAASCIAEMDYAGVDAALMHVELMLGRDVAYLADCVRRYPTRLRSMAPVDEWRIRSDPDGVIREVTAAINDFGLHAVKFSALYAYLLSPDPWDGGVYRPFWDAVTRLGVPIFFTLPISSNDQSAYLREQRILMRWMERYPDVTVSLTHGFPWRALREGDGFVLPDDIWQPFKNPKLHLEISLPIRIGDWWEYPYRETWPAVEQMVDRVGSRRILWGTDMPFQNRFCTYRQGRAYIEKYLAFLGAEDVAAIMGGNAERLLDFTK
jgi:predicted TIM-barrel fold metal-dependent hydrolase